jgi:hypothetical protein
VLEDANCKKIELIVYEAEDASEWDRITIEKITYQDDHCCSCNSTYAGAFMTGLVWDQTNTCKYKYHANISSYDMHKCLNDKDNPDPNDFCPLLKLHVVPQEEHNLGLTCFLDLKRLQEQIV